MKQTQRTSLNWCNSLSEIKELKVINCFYFPKWAITLKKLINQLETWPVHFLSLQYLLEFLSTIPYLTRLVQ